MSAPPIQSGAPKPRNRRKASLLPMPTPIRSPEPTPALRAVLAHSLNETAVAIRSSTRHVRRLIRTGRLKAKRDGRRVLILDADLQRYLDELPAAN